MGIRKEYLEKMFDYEIGSDDYLVAIKVMSKALKEKMQIFIGRKDDFIQKKKNIIDQFMSEMVILPLNYSFYIKSHLV